MLGTKTKGVQMASMEVRMTPLCCAKCTQM